MNIKNKIGKFLYDNIGVYFNPTPLQIQMELHKELTEAMEKLPSTKEILSEIYDVLTEIIISSNFIHDKIIINSDGELKHSRPEDLDPDIEIQQIKDNQYNIYKNSIKLERLINTYFDIDPESKNRIKVFYSEDYAALHVKQPLFKQISDHDAKLILLKSTVNDCLLDNNVIHDFVYKPNLLDISL